MSIKYGPEHPPPLLFGLCRMPSGHMCVHAGASVFLSVSLHCMGRLYVTMWAVCGGGGGDPLVVFGSI